MNTNRKPLSLLAKLFGALSLCGVMAVFTGCEESISEEDFAIKSELTMTDYLTENPQDFSLLKAIFDRVRLGNTSNASTLTNVLAARGNYTLFAPNDSAITAYLAEQGVQTVDELPYELAQLVAYSCLIDNENQSAYEVAEFSTNGGSFPITNFNDRLLNSRQDSINDYWINNMAKVLNFNIEVSNGMIHEISAVITPSTDNLYKRIAAADNMKVMAHLMEVTGWDVIFDVEERDVAYEEVTHDLTRSTPVGTCEVPDSRLIGFTGFVETDSVYASEWGINLNIVDGQVQNWDDVMKKVATECANVYKDEVVSEEVRNDLTHPDNPVNRFVAYHFVYGKMAYNRFVQHFNEYNYKCGSTPAEPQPINMPTNVWDYYTTMGEHPALLKITQVGDASLAPLPDGLTAVEHPILLNRISKYDDSSNGDYHEVDVVNGYEGILVSAFNGDKNENDNDARNGYYYPINKILKYEKLFAEELGRERLRMDVTTMLPEMASNSFRGSKYRTFESGYFDNIINESPGTTICYIHEAYYGNVGSWKDYQGDEFNITGLYDLTLKLPPVPVDGMYEVRMAASNNSTRGMLQVYFGTEPDKLPPVGLPFDMRIAQADLGWVADVEDDEVNAENDRNFRYNGYMKGPNYFTSANTGTTGCREFTNPFAALRRIITTQWMEADKTYYIRFKSALKNTKSQFFLDYLEFVRTNIYNGTKAEDIW